MMGKVKNVKQILNHLSGELVEYGAGKKDVRAISVFAEELIILYGEKIPEDTEISVRVVRTVKEFSVIFKIPGEEYSPEDLQKNQKVFILDNIVNKMGYTMTSSYSEQKNTIKIRIEYYHPLKEYIKLALSYLDTSKKHLVSGSLLHILSIVINIIIPYMTGIMINHYINNSFTQIIIVSIAIMAARVVYSAFIKISGDFYNECTFTIRENLSANLIKNMLRVTDNTFETMGSGPFNKRIFDDAEVIAQALPGFSDKISEASYYVGILFVTLIMNPVVFLIELVFFLILFILEKRRTNLFYIDLKNVRVTDENRYTMVMDTINGAQEIKSLGGNNLVIEKVRNAQILSNKKERAALRNSSRRTLINDIVSAVFYSVVLVYFGYAINNGTLSVANCLILFNYFSLIGIPMVKLIQNLMTQAKQFSLSCERLVDLCTGSAFPKENYGKKHVEHLKGEIRFDNVSFSYQYNDPTVAHRMILKDIDILVSPASSTAFVGKSGCGKSTTIKLITGSQHASYGTVLLDGVDIREYDEATLRKNITIVSQKPFFFNASVLENMRIVKPDATMEEIRSACEKACILEDIERHPDGFNMELGEKGTRVSGGQLQRLAIARALLKGGRIILLDEATSAVDNVTQDKIVQVIEELKKDHTIVLVAHRLTTIQNADKIFLLNDHKVIADGTHNELMEKSEEYKGMYQKEAR